MTCRGLFSTNISMILYLYRRCKQNTDFCGSEKIFFVLFSTDFLTLPNIFYFLAAVEHQADVPMDTFS